MPPPKHLAAGLSSVPLQVLALPQLSERGVKHLEADVKYLSNVFHALDLAAPPVLEHLSLVTSLSRDEAVTRLVQKTVVGEGTGVENRQAWCFSRAFIPIKSSATSFGMGSRMTRKRGKTGNYHTASI